MAPLADYHKSRLCGAPSGLTQITTRRHLAAHQNNITKIEQNPSANLNLINYYSGHKFTVHNVVSIMYIHWKQIWTPRNLCWCVRGVAREGEGGMLWTVLARNCTRTCVRSDAKHSPAHNHYNQTPKQQGHTLYCKTYQPYRYILQNNIFAACAAFSGKLVRFVIILISKCCYAMIGPRRQRSCFGQRRRDADICHYVRLTPTHPLVCQRGIN